MPVPWVSVLPITPHRARTNPAITPSHTTEPGNGTPRSVGYSTRTGRSKPRISIGKRIADRIRLSAETGLSDAREVRAAIEWQLDDSVQMSYDNYNFTGTSALGNLGLDVGYRLELE